MNRLAILAGAFALLNLGAPASAAVDNLVTNGDFSDPNVNGGWTNSQIVPGWPNLTES
jgi:hypothetical protein